MSFVAGGVTKLSNETLYQQQHHLQRPKPSTTDLNDRAMQHPLCTHNTSAYVGQTAKMYCCLARLDRDLSVSDLFIFYHWFPKPGLSYFMILCYLLSILVSRWVHASSLGAFRLLTGCNSEECTSILKVNIFYKYCFKNIGPVQGCRAISGVS